MDNTTPQLHVTAFLNFGWTAGHEMWREAIGATGASYHKDDQRWHLRGDAEPLPVDTINRLFEIAREYRAVIKLELLPPEHPS